MTFEQIIQSIQQRKFFPIYLLMGEEPYYIDEISALLEESVLDESSREFNLSIVYGRDVNTQTLLSYVKRYPMMSDYQVVIVREAQDMRDIESMAAYAENPMSSTILVFCYKYKKLDKRRALARAIGKSGVVFESARLYENKIPAWISSYLDKRGFRIDPQALMLVSEHLGNELGTVVNELQKLTINLKAGELITADTIEANIGISKEFNVFELQKAIGKGDSYQSFRIIKYLSASGKDFSPAAITSTLYSFFNKLLILHSLKDKSKQNVANILGVNPFFVDEYMHALRTYPVERLEKVMRVLRTFDLKAKGYESASAQPEELVKEMTYHILN
jgi:DNA polymerase III subunit delta